MLLIILTFCETYILSLLCVELCLLTLGTCGCDLI